MVGSQSSLGRRAFVLGTAALTLVACGPRRELTAPPQVVGNVVFVKVKKAWVTGSRIYVQTWMKNQSKQPMIIDRDGMQLRLLDGETLERSSGRTTQHSPYQLAPGIGRDVHVDFMVDDVAKLDNLQKAYLILGGISLGDSVEPKVVGELELVMSAGPDEGGDASGEGEGDAKGGGEKGGDEKGGGAKGE
ncbi:MAG: hypothetical protein HOV80_28285 [Polyangiaceae bacterium]|nr:hypothetical protein [Polyangiaceae bacterium]